MSSFLAPSLVASLKLRMPFPIPRPMSGRRFAPKIRITMKRMMSISGKPILPNICCSLRLIVPPTVGLALFIVGLPASARQFTSQVNLVEVYATVTDARGAVVPNLTRDDFEVLEDGARQEIAA